MSKTMRTGKYTLSTSGGSRIRKPRRGSTKRDETAETAVYGSPALSNRAMQRILPGLRPGEPNAAQRLREAGGLNAPMPVSALAPQVLRQVAEEALAEQTAEETADKPKVVQGRVTVQPVQFDYYDVSGETLADVAGQLDPDEWGHCRANYSYSYAATGGKTTRVNVTVTITIRLPRWRGNGWNKASPAAKAEWNRMLTALRTHEDRHAEIGRRWGPTMQERLYGIDESNVAAEGSAVEAEAQAEQDKFDADTAHGQNTGVSLDTSIP